MPSRSACQTLRNPYRLARCRKSETMTQCWDCHFFRKYLWHVQYCYDRFLAVKFNSGRAGWQPTQKTSDHLQTHLHTPTLWHMTPGDRKHTFIASLFPTKPAYRPCLASTSYKARSQQAYFRTNCYTFHICKQALSVYAMFCFKELHRAETANIVSHNRQLCLHLLCMHVLSVMGIPWSSGLPKNIQISHASEQHCIPFFFFAREFALLSHLILFLGVMQCDQKFLCLHTPWCEKYANTFVFWHKHHTSYAHSSHHVKCVHTSLNLHVTPSISLLTDTIMWNVCLLFRIDTSAQNFLYSAIQSFQSRAHWFSCEFQVWFLLC